METDLKILAIDDNRDNLMALRAVVADRLPGSRLLTTLNGPQGLELARAENPVVILLDIVMPGMDGYAVCRELKKDERLQTIPVLFLTATRTDRDSRIKALEAGAEGFLSKPLDEVELIAQIRAMAKIKEANQLQRLEKNQLAALVAERTRELEHELAERKKAEEELKKSETQYRSLSQEFNGLLDAIPDSLMLLDRELHILWVNRAAAALCIDTTAAELAGRPCYTLWCERTTPCEPCPVVQCFESGLPSDAILTRPGGRSWDVRTVPIWDGQGKITKVIKLERDVTEHKKLEKQYLHAQKMETIGTLAGGVAHDFNNILTVIVGLGEMTLMKMVEDNPHRRNIGGILEAAERATHLTRELLLFSRKQQSERRPVDLNDIVSKMEKFLHRVIGEDIALKLIPHDLPLPVLADSNQLEQVLMNLAVNSRDVMLHGGEFVLQTEKTELHEDFVATHGYGQPGFFALLTVSDTGTGMDQATQQRIFEPFFSTKEVGKGTGLGLSVVYGIIKQHDGFITVSSEPGQGSTFRIYLPLTTMARQEIGAQQELPVVGGTETILLAEDNDLVREMVTGVLTEAGYTVIVAANGAEAVRKFRENADAIDLLFFDLIMPKMNGKAAADAIHQMRPAMKTIFASGYSPDIAQQKASLDDGSYLNKPVSPRDLLQKVRDVLDGGRS